VTWVFHALLLATMLAPLCMLAAMAWQGPRAAMPFILGVAPLPGLAAALFSPGQPPLVLYADWLRLTFTLDGPAALLLGTAALLWAAAGHYAGAYLGRGPGGARFAGWWLVTLAGSLGVFIAGDLVTFYLAFALVSLTAWGLVVHDRSDAARRAGSVYLLLAVLGELFLLLGFALLAVNTPSPTLAIADVVAALPFSPWRDMTVLLLILGFGLKAGMVPLHVWLPLAHPAAPMPASAVLSGVIIKAGIIGLIRFLPMGDAWGLALGYMGFLTAFYGVALGVTQQNPKAVLAYSSVSQMGVVMAVLGFGAAAGDAGVGLAGAFYAAHHMLAKGALFLGLGVALATGPRRLGWVLALVWLLALSLGGLPLTGGWLAKAAIKGQMGEGALAAVSAAGTTMLMLHCARRMQALARAQAPGRAPPGLVLPFAATALAGLLLPWALYPGEIADALTAKALLSAIWPLALGGLGALALRRWGRALPDIPPGDVLVFAERGFAAAAGPAALAADRVERRLRLWPSAGMALLGLMVVLGLAMALAG
jgi:formate hydrogenlyase subunit 3/multisubunit Na+/H+ antiporter MnhD subunit